MLSRTRALQTLHASYSFPPRATGARSTAQADLVWVVRCQPRRSASKAKAGIQLAAWESPRSEERRVGKECRSRWWRDHQKEQEPAAQVPVGRRTSVGG